MNEQVNNSDSVFNRQSQTMNNPQQMHTTNQSSWDKIGSILIIVGSSINLIGFLIGIIGLIVTISSANFANIDNPDFNTDIMRTAAIASGVVGIIIMIICLVINILLITFAAGILKHKIKRGKILATGILGIIFGSILGIIGGIFLIIYYANSGQSQPNSYQTNSQN